MRFCIAAILMLIMSFQVLPVKKISKLFGKSQNSEQVQNSNACDDDDAGSFNLANADLLVPDVSFNYPCDNARFYHVVSLGVMRTDVLPVIQVASIPSPPPEC